MSMDKWMIEKFMENGLTEKEANYLNKALRDNSSYVYDDYAKALNRKTTKISATQDALDAKDFMDSFRSKNDKQMTTEKFFDKTIDYSRDPGAGKVSDGYLEAINKQRTKPNLKLVDNKGLADIKMLLLIEGARKALEIKDVGAGSDIVPHIESDKHDIMKKKLMMNMKETL